VLIAMLLGRALLVYLWVAVSNLLKNKVRRRWQHVIIRASCAVSSLSLSHLQSRRFPERGRIPDLIFGVVIFFILLQGLTIKPLL
jgi:NhaP-type Na+/H+ or K+/H+ antiporter